MINLKFVISDIIFGYNPYQFFDFAGKGHLWIKWEFSLIDKYVAFKDAKAWFFVVSVFWHILKVSGTIYVGCTSKHCAVHIV